MLDYGGGNGVLAESLRTVGFPHVDTYDPFVPPFASGRPIASIALSASRWSSIPPIPHSLFADMNDLLDGLRASILFSTLLAARRYRPPGPELVVRRPPKCSCVSLHKSKPAQGRRSASGSIWARSPRATMSSFEISPTSRNTSSKWIEARPQLERRHDSAMTHRSYLPWS